MGLRPARALPDSAARHILAQLGQGLRQLHGHLVRLIGKQMLRDVTHIPVALEQSHPVVVHGPQRSSLRRGLAGFDGNDIGLKAAHAFEVRRRIRKAERRRHAAIAPEQQLPWRPLKVRTAQPEERQERGDADAARYPPELAEQRRGQEREEGDHARPESPDRAWQIPATRGAPSTRRPWLRVGRRRPADRCARR